MAQITRFAGVEGKKRSPRPSPGEVRVTAEGLELIRQPESRQTWKGHEASNRLAWQPVQACQVALSPRERVELACALLDSVVLAELAAIEEFRGAED